MSDAKMSFGEEIARYFTGSCEIRGGWQMNFLFPNGVRVGFGYRNDEAFFETVEPDGTRILFEGIQRSAVGELFREAMTRKVKAGVR